MMQRLPDGWQECQVEEVLVFLLNLVGTQGKRRTQKAMLVIMVVMMTIIIVFVPPQEGQGRV